METETDSLEFIFSKISYIHSSHLCSHPYVPLSFPIVEPRAFWSTEMTAIPKSTLGKGKRTQLLQDFLPLLLLVGILNPFRFWASSLWIFTNFLYFSLRSWRFFWCEFDFWPWFFIYTAAQGQKRKRWGELAWEFFSHYPPPSAPPPPPSIIFWFDLGSGFRTAVSFTLRTTKEETHTPKNHQGRCPKGATG